MIKYKSSRLIHVFLNIFDVSLLPKEHYQNYWKFLQVNNITILLQYTSYRSQYFTTACLHGWNLSTNLSNGLMILFNWDWSRLTNKLSLIGSLNLFALEATISKWRKSIKQLHSIRWSDTADCLIHLRRFPVNLEMPICSAALVKKWRCVLT